ncbi:PAS domain-containing protein [Nafulsella turpanensis]|uniref:PAS domain-containing protein n=1 Tax=Nafulsella turpanensis TaxID=1265690 RepID=UPI00034CBBCB|nr:PAS domain-containing protein [Nafulsella turpanensis]
MELRGPAQSPEGEPEISYQKLEGLATHVLTSQLDKATQLNLKIAQQSKLPLLKLFAHLTEAELFELSKKGVKDFFEQLASHTALQEAKKSFLEWKNGKQIGFSREAVQLNDIVLTYSIRKQVILQLLPGYTSDCLLIVAIMEELEQLHQQIEQWAFQVYLDIQQENLHSENSFLTSLIKFNTGGIMALNRQKEVTEWNPALEQILGIEKNKALGRSIFELIPALAGTEIEVAVEDSLNGKSIHLPRHPFKSRKGFYDAHVSPLYDQHQQVCGCMAVITDISERVKAEEQLKEHKEELQAANEELTEQREELQAANEELTEQREEIEAANEELQESLTQLEEAQEALQQTVDQLEEAQQIAHLGSFEYHIPSDNVWWSKEMKRIFGLSTGELSMNYEEYLTFIHPEDLEFVKQTIARAIEQKQSYTFQHRIIRRDGSIRWLQSNGKLVFSSDGKMYQLKGTSLDITERKLVELQIQEEQYFVQKVTETTPDIISVFDLEKRANIYGNRELTQVLGYSAEEMEELRKDPLFLPKMIHPEDMQNATQFLKEYREYTGTEAREVEYRIRRNTGEYIWVSARYHVFRRDAKGFPIQIIGITRDINEKKKADEELKQTNFKLHETNEELVRTEELLKEANNELEEQVQRRTAELQNKNVQLQKINADLDSFIYTASHDLKAPIANLEGLLILLDKKLQERLPEKDHNLLAMMKTSIDRFKQTIADLSDVTKMQKELEDQVNEIVQLPEVFEDVKQDINGLIRKNGAIIHSSFEVEEIAFDRKNLRSIFYNLLANGIKYRSPDRPPELFVTTSRNRDGEVVLSIRDNGEGIPENQYEKIFSLFKRLHKNVEGSGMGLYIVKKIVENNGGRIEVESTVGQGTNFKIYLQNEETPECNTVGR